MDCRAHVSTAATPTDAAFGYGYFGMSFDFESGLAGAGAVAGAAGLAGDTGTPAAGAAGALLLSTRGDCMTLVACAV